MTRPALNRSYAISIPRHRHQTPSLRIDRHGNFLACAVHTIRQHRAYLQTCMPAFTGNIGTLPAIYRTPAIHAD